MSAAALSLDLRADRRRTRFSMGTSFVVHALLLLLLIFYRHDEPVVPPIAEITWLEPGDLAGSPAVAAAAQPSPGPVTTTTPDQHFRRSERSAEIEPAPQSDVVLSDRLNARLAALQGSGPPTLAMATATVPSGAISTPAGIPRGTGGGGTAPIELHRGGLGAGTGPSLTLNRGGGSGAAPALVTTPTSAERGTAAPAAGGGDAGARRVLAGAALMGPVADRRILSRVTPVYPEWAKREGVEGTVSLYFVVRPDGTVKENVLVQKTAGFEDFDESARTALRAWRFERLAAGRTGEQWGTITLRFQLHSVD